MKLNKHDIAQLVILILIGSLGLTSAIQFQNYKDRPYELEEYGFQSPFYTFWVAEIDNITICDSWFTYHTNGSFFFYAVAERIIYLEISADEINYFVMYEGLLYQTLFFENLNTDFLHIENVTFWRVVK